jgi:hypothetical protein
LKKEQTLNIKFQTLTTALLIDRPTIWWQERMLTFRKRVLNFNVYYDVHS